MLALRLARGARPATLVRGLLVAATAGGTGFLLLSSLGHAMGHPADRTASLVRLLWCALPLAAVVQLAVAVARAEPGTRPPRGLASAGFGPLRLALLGAASTAVWCALGCVSALLVFLYLRGDLGRAAVGGGAGEFLSAGRSLPFPAALTLLALVPALAGAAAATVLRPGKRSADPAPPDPEPAARRPATVAAPAVARMPGAFPWGVALTAAGLALGAYTAPATPRFGPDARPDSLPPGVVGGWVLVTIGLVMLCPGVAHLCGRLLAAGRPGALRLLSGRVLQAEAQRIGRPAGVLCAVTAAGFAAGRVYEAASPSAASRGFGPLTVLGAAVVVACAAVTVITAALEARAARGGTTAALGRVGAPTGLLRRAALLRAAVLVAVLAPLTWAVAELSAFPLTH